jgi:hypothetical protein
MTAPPRAVDYLYEISPSIAVRRSRSRKVETLRLDSEAAARGVLLRHFSTRAGIRQLRVLLAERTASGVVARLDDGEVIDQMSRRIAARELLLTRKAVVFRAYRFEEEAVEEVKRPSSDGEAHFLTAWVEADAEPVVLDPAVAREADLGGFDTGLAGDANADLDGPVEFDPALAAAQAAALKDAAAQGIPFCEECQKAKAAARP